MHLLPLLLVAGFASAAPANTSSVIQALAPIKNQNRTYTKDEVHANVLKDLPSERIVQSHGLHQYFEENFGSNHTIYIADQQKWVDMGSVTVKQPSGNLTTRQTGCYGYTSTWAEQHQSFWGAWTASSGCLWTGYDPAGASMGISWSKSLSVEENAGLSWSTIASVLGASVGFGITTTWSHGGDQTCFIPGNSVGQIWAQNYLGWGWFWSASCFVCGNDQYCDASYVNGGATAPASSAQWGQGFNLGCSTGSNKVSC